MKPSPTIPKRRQKKNERYADRFDDPACWALMADSVIGEFCQWLEAIAYWKSPARRKKLACVGNHVARDCPGGFHIPAYEEIHVIARKAFMRLYDESLCNEECKGMYFCTLKINHKGEHRYW